jgi:hypothetical protein
MTIEEALNILCKKTYLVDKSNEDNIIPLDQLYGVDCTADNTYIIFDCDIKDGIPDIYRLLPPIETEIMGVNVEKVPYGDEYKAIYTHMKTLENEANSQK